MKIYPRQLPTEPHLLELKYIRRYIDNKGYLVYEVRGAKFREFFLKRLALDLNESIKLGLYKRGSRVIVTWDMDNQPITHVRII